MKGRSQEQGRDPTRLRTLVTVASTTAVLCATAGVASAQNSGSSATDGGTTTSSSGGSSGSGTVRLKSEDAAPGKIFYYGARKAVYRYSIGGSRPRDLKVEAVRRGTWKVVRTWRRDDVEPDREQTIRWSGTTKGGGVARKGTYLFRVRERGGGVIDRPRAKGDRSFGLYPHKFPVRGRHTYGDGFGAPRSGHRHQGQDILADCGKKVVAARGGRVQWRANQPSGAGYYVVIDGKSTGHDYVYMHLRRGGRPKRGERVRTGERIGYVGQTGDASGCHLHFELWSRPGWYEGGRAMRAVTKHLREWDSWS